VWLAARIGDWVAADEEARRRGRADLLRLTGPHARVCREEWLLLLRKELKERGPSAGLLGALADAGAGEAAALIGRALADKKRAHSTLELIDDDPAWRSSIFELLMRFHQPADAFSLLPRGYARYLGKHDHRVPPVLAYLLREQQPAYDLILPMAARHAPARLREFASSALRSQSPEDRLTAAALLVRLGHRWCKQLLSQRLDEADSVETALECLEALGRNDCPELQAQARHWARQHAGGLAREVQGERCYNMYCIDGVRGAFSDRVAGLELS
jgi:hypothetical protein